MRLAILLLTGACALGAETFSVVHHKTAWWDGKGTVEITDEGIRFEAAGKPGNSRNWSWLDIQHFDRISPNEFVVLTYEDQNWYLGRDRSWRFTITDGELSGDLFDRIAQYLARPVTNRVVAEAPDTVYEVPVKHLHVAGGCEGLLQFTNNAVYYVTGHAAHARQWLLARDVDSVWSANPYRLELHVYDNNRREFSRRRVYKFDLKERLDADFYRDLKLRMYGVRERD